MVRVIAGMVLALWGAAVQAAPLEWQNFLRKLDLGGGQATKLEYAILPLPDGNQVRVSCTGTREPHFQVLLKTSDAQKSPLTFRIVEGGKVEFWAVGPLVYRQLKGIHRAVPAGGLNRLMKSETLRVSINNGLHWHDVAQDSTRAVLPELTCFKNN